MTARPTTPIELVVFDMAGTTIVDDGLVEQAFARAAERTGAVALPADEALQYVRDTMGQSKIEVFTHLAAGDREAAARANAAFEDAYAELVDEQGVTEVPGAGDTVRALRAAGVQVALTTGFAPATRDAILRHIDWTDEIVAALSPADVGRGRPAPDLVLGALLRAGASSVAAVAVAGDTASDMESGLRAGAGLVAGVLSGAHGRPALLRAGADAVIPDVTHLPALLGIRGRIVEADIEDAEDDSVAASFAPVSAR
ncbi:phosphonatase-like hydrolase [Microbacterium candidum]|uniref:Phosphonatase-like hydrolase n=1 Tax=Microbacterium candidum TaxID=3041922 RepID=A0ABT7MY46_9MICO|nr:phosphonatase-like hydrolase [Microbacterium sp. ASV49]MDL9979351.1 phosphonatase-like hydrolase [Microbacterium sp. ASV49]